MDGAGPWCPIEDVSPFEGLSGLDLALLGSMLPPLDTDSSEAFALLQMAWNTNHPVVVP